MNMQVSMLDHLVTFSAFSGRLQVFSFKLDVVFNYVINFTHSHIDSVLFWPSLIYIITSCKAMLFQQRFSAGNLFLFSIRNTVFELGFLGIRAQKEMSFMFQISSE